MSDDSAPCRCGCEASTHDHFKEWLTYCGRCGPAVCDRYRPDREPRDFALWGALRQLTARAWRALS